MPNSPVVLDHFAPLFGVQLGNEKYARNVLRAAGLAKGLTEEQTVLEAMKRGGTNTQNVRVFRKGTDKSKGLQVLGKLAPKADNTLYQLARAAVAKNPNISLHELVNQLFHSHPGVKKNAKDGLRQGKKGGGEAAKTAKRAKKRAPTLTKKTIKSAGAKKKAKKAATGVGNAPK